MKDWSGGMSLVLEGKSRAGSPNNNGAVDLVAIGYKYNSTKVLCFVATKDAGTTRDGKPYFARYLDAFQNVASRSVPRPDVISKYFERSNVVDKHNQARQYELALEKHWVTESAWFRLVTTIIGTTLLLSHLPHQLGKLTSPSSWLLLLVVLLLVFFLFS